MREHPFLHLFPGLKYLVDQADVKGAPKDGVIKYDPFMELDTEGERGTMKFDFVPRDGLSRFIYNPWFEPISGYDYSSWYEKSVGQRQGYPYMAQGPHWFGNNSTRGVLANVVTGVLANAKYDRVKSVDFPWKTHGRYMLYPEEEVKEVPWSLGDYLRTPVRRPMEQEWGGDLYLREGTFVVPTTYWEFLHPKLPIVKVTSYNRTVFPFKRPDYSLAEISTEELTARLLDINSPLLRFLDTIDRHEAKRLGLAQLYNDCVRMDFGGRCRSELQEMSQEVSRKDLEQLFGLITEESQEAMLSNPPSPTAFAVSFVISFQNRWTAFDDPDRWLIRFNRDLFDADSDGYRRGSELFRASQGAVDPEIHDERFPNYWHNTDYMQHRLIGPVIVQVYESDVIQPGIYAVNPRVAGWEAPGYVVPDDRQLLVKGAILREDVEGRPLDAETFAGGKAAGIGYSGDSLLGNELDGLVVHEGRLPLRAVPQSPNPGYPLPGHVMTSAHTAPGTEVWERFMMDGHDW